jgi:hypothetical protein
MAVVFLLVIVSAVSSCAQPTRYSAGIGGNLLPVAKAKDGTWMFAPYDEVMKMSNSDRKRFMREFEELDTN